MQFVKNPHLKKILTFFGYSIAVSVIIYIILGLFVSDTGATSQTLDVIRFFLPVLIFPLFAVFAAKSILQLTKSNLIRAVVFMSFALFPFILLSFIVFIAIITGNFHPIFGL